MKERDSAMDHTGTVVISLPLEQLCHLQWVTSVEHAAWVCRLCPETGHAATEPLARSGATQHLVGHHGATVMGD